MNIHEGKCPVHEILVHVSIAYVSSKTRVSRLVSARIRYSIRPIYYSILLVTVLAFLNNKFAQPL